MQVSSLTGQTALYISKVYAHTHIYDYFSQLIHAQMQRCGLQNEEVCHMSQAGT